MADPDIPEAITDTDVTLATFPLPHEGKVLVLVEANAHVTHVISLSAQAARNLVVGLLDALDIAAPVDDGDTWWDRG